MKPAVTTVAPIHVRLLDGTFSRDGRMEPLACREHAFVGLLAVSARPRSVPDIAESLWPGRDLESARNCAKVYASRVRLRLGCKDSICWSTAGYALGASVTVDTRRIECTLAAVRAAAAPDDGLLSEAEDALSRLAAAPAVVRAFPELDRYLAALATDLATVLYTDARRRGDHQGAVRAGLGLVAFDPCEELGRELVIRGRLALGDELGAFCTFREYARALHDELDAEPSERLRALLGIGQQYAFFTPANDAMYRTAVFATR